MTKKKIAVTQDAFDEAVKKAATKKESKVKKKETPPKIKVKAGLGRDPESDEEWLQKLMSNNGTAVADDAFIRPVYIVCTSGSSGVPKVCVGTEAGLMNRCMWMHREFEYKEKDISDGVSNGGSRIPKYHINNIRRTRFPLYPIYRKNGSSPNQR